MSDLVQKFDQAPRLTDRPAARSTEATAAHVAAALHPPPHPPVTKHLPNSRLHGSEL